MKCITYPLHQRSRSRMRLLNSLSTRSSSSTVRACIAMARDSRPGPGMRSIHRYSTPRRANSIDNTHAAAPPPTINTGTSVMLGIEVRRNVAAGLTTPSAPLRSLRGIFLVAQPPLLCEEGNVTKHDSEQQLYG